MMKLRALIIALFCVVAFSAPASSREAIVDFTCEATVNVDATLDVIETLVVNAEGYQIKRGILRDFPTLYKDNNGLNVRIDFDVTRVERDGRNETYALENLSNGVRIRIGNRDVFLDNGQHTYKIYYRTKGHIGFFETYDELYWNVTGNSWTLPINRARAIIKLPTGATISKSVIYTGTYGERANLAKTLQSTGNRFAAETTSSLDPDEGFSVAVAWQKGIVTPPTVFDKLIWFLRDNLGIFALLATLITATLYYVFAWNKVGRDPIGGTIIPLFAPPADIGPAGVRYIWRQGFDDRAFSAAVVGLAVKGGVKITDSNDDLSITRKPPGETARLSISETALYNALPNSKLDLKQANHASIRRAKDALENVLHAEFNGAMFLHNFGWYVLGAVISILGLAVSVFLMRSEAGIVGAMMVGGGAVWWGIILSIVWSAIRGLSVSGFFSRVAAIGKLLVLIPIGFVSVGLPVAFSQSEFGQLLTPELLWVVGIGSALAALNVLFYFLMPAPTPVGRGVLDKIEGFRMYMTTAEEERLKILHPPEKTPALFEKYLPYALALDCENEWNAKFSAVLAAAAATGAAVGAGWYYGHNFGSNSTTDFTERLGSSLTSSVSSSSTPPGSSSGTSGYSGGGSSGGGFSGGGGGGGGGSGW